MLLAYSGWTSTVEERPYNSPRIWATLSPVDAIEEGQPAAVPAARPAATIVRNVLALPDAPHAATSTLLSIDGRRVLSLRPGTNDISGLAPGVYYLSEHPASRNERPALVSFRKLIVTK